MNLRLRIFGLPLHPLLVHFPIVFWLSLVPLDLTALYTGEELWWTIAFLATVIGLVVGAAAIAAGLLEYIQPTLVGIDMRLAARHGIRTSLAWCIFLLRAVVAFTLPFEDNTIWMCLALDVAGSLLLVQGVYFGTRQVYQQLEGD